MGDIYTLFQDEVGTTELQVFLVDTCWHGFHHKLVYLGGVVPYVICGRSVVRPEACYVAVLACRAQRRWGLDVEVRYVDLAWVLGSQTLLLVAEQLLRALVPGVAPALSAEAHPGSHLALLTHLPKQLQPVLHSCARWSCYWLRNKPNCPLLWAFSSTPKISCRLDQVSSVDGDGGGGGCRGKENNGRDILPLFLFKVVEVALPSHWALYKGGNL